MLSKYIRFLIGGFAVFMLIEAGILIYMDRSVLKETNSFKVQKIQNNVSKSTSTLKVYLSKTAENVKASFDGKFLAYTDGGVLKILNMEKNTSTNIAMDSGMTLDFYKWVYDRDQLIIAERNNGISSNDSTSSKTQKYFVSGSSSQGQTSGSYGQYLKLYNLNAKELSENSTPEEIRDTVNNESAKIKLSKKNYHVTDIVFSTSTVINYLKITDSAGNSILWKLNIPSENEAISSVKTKNIGTIECLKSESELLYEDLSTNKLYVADKGMIKANGNGQLRILGIDNNDNLYFAVPESGNKTSVILYGSIIKGGTDETETSIDTTPECEQISLDTPVKIENIHVTQQGNIYEQDAANRIFKNLKTNKTISYSGKVIAFFGSGFITESNGLLHTVYLK